MPPSPAISPASSIDPQHGRRLALNLWEKRSAQRPSSFCPRTQVARLLNPLMSSPSEVLGAHTVIATNLASAGS